MVATLRHRSATHGEHRGRVVSPCDDDEMTDALVSVTPIVLVHGAWHGAWCWSALQAELNKRGVPSYAVDLPGHGVSDRPLGDLHRDAAHVADVIDRLAIDVVLVGHSYGGAVITEAALHTDRVRHLVYLTAFVLDEGESLSSIPMLDSAPPQQIIGLRGARRTLDDGTIVLDPVAAIPALYGCCEPAVQQAAAARLSPQPKASFAQAVTGASWKRVPQHLRALHRRPSDRSRPSRCDGAAMRHGADSGDRPLAVRIDAGRHRRHPRSDCEERSASCDQSSAARRARARTALR